MKAIVQHRYGPSSVLELAELATPTAGAGEVLVRVHATSLHPDVWHATNGRPYVLRIMGSGVRRPKQPIPGTDLAGRVEAVGAGVTRFAVGDDVFGETLVGQQWKNAGAFAEYVVVPEKALEPMPSTVDYAHAAAVPTSAFIALACLRDQGRVEAGQRVLVNGAGGGVGMYVLQLAKAFGAHVTAVDSTSKLDMLRTLGADVVIDYTSEDFTKGSEVYDLIVDIPGNHKLADLRGVITPDGTYLLVGHDNYGDGVGSWLGGMGKALRLMAVSPFIKQVPGLRLTKDDGTRLAELAALMEAGRLTSVIDRTFALAQAAEALDYLASGRAVGKVVITV